jgi:polar amino acid transport system permease protein
VLFQIIFIYNVLPSFGIRFSAFVCAVLALSLNEGAFMSEIFRSGLHAVKQGQRTAGFALGMNGAKVFRHIVLPQALRVVLPPIGNQMIGMLKLSALVSVIAVQELLLVANQAASANFRYLEALSAAGIYYLAFTTLFMLLQGWMERALNRRRKSTVRRTSFAERLLGVSQPVVR